MSSFLIRKCIVVVHIIVKPQLKKSALIVHPLAGTIYLGSVFVRTKLNHKLKCNKQLHFL